MGFNSAFKGLIQSSSWRWAQSCSKHAEDSNKHIIEETVRQVGYLPELYEDARSEKNIYNFLVPVRCWPRDVNSRRHLLPPPVHPFAYATFRPKDARRCLSEWRKWSGPTIQPLAWLASEFIKKLWHQRKRTLHSRIARWQAANCCGVFTAVPWKSFPSFYEATKKLGNTENGANLWALR